MRIAGGGRADEYTAKHHLPSKMFGRSETKTRTNDMLSWTRIIHWALLSRSVYFKQQHADCTVVSAWMIAFFDTPTTMSYLIK